MPDCLSNYTSALSHVSSRKSPMSCLTVSKYYICQDHLLKMYCEREMKHVQVDSYFRDGEQKQ